jgi:hypothetical protein
MRVRVSSFAAAAASLLLVVGISPAAAQGQITTTTTIQSTEHEGIGIGLKIGPLFSSLNSDVVTDPPETRTGWIGGLFIGGNRPGLIGVQADILFARKKVGTPTGDVTLDYLEIPILLRLNAGSSNLGGVSVFGVVGPAFDVRLKGKLNFDEGIDDQTEAVDVGLSVGAGVEITRFIIEGRYTRGLRSIDKGLSLDRKIKTESFAVMFGLRFN